MIFLSINEVNDAVAPQLCVWYPTLLLMDTILRFEAQLREAPLTSQGVSQLRLGWLEVPCVDPEGNPFLADAQLVIEEGEVWWIGPCLAGGEESWQTDPIPLQVLKADAAGRLMAARTCSCN